MNFLIKKFGNVNPNFKYDIKSDELYDLYIIKNKTVIEISNLFNCAVNTINKKLRQHKIYKPKSNIYNLVVDDIKIHLINGLNYVQIGKIYGCSNKIIHKFVKKITYMSKNNVPITRLGKFFSQNDFFLEVDLGMEWLIGDMNYTCVLYKIDRNKIKTDDVYGEVVSDGIKFLPPVEFNAQVTIAAPENKFIGTSTKMDQVEPGNITISVYLKTLQDLQIDVDFGDYIGYYDSENFVRYYTVVNDGRVVSDTKHTYKGFKPFYRTIIASPVGPNEFRGL